MSGCAMMFISAIKLVFKKLKESIFYTFKKMSSFLMFQDAFFHHFISDERIFFSHSFRVGLLAICSLSLSSSFILNSLYFLKAVFAQYRILWLTHFSFSIWPMCYFSDVNSLFLMRNLLLVEFFFLFGVFFFPLLLLIFFFFSFHKYSKVWC